MCKSLDEGGLRCDSHNHQKLEAANGVLSRALLKEAGLNGVNSADKRYELIPHNENFMDNDEALKIIRVKESINNLPKYSSYGTLLKIDSSIEPDEFLKETIIEHVNLNFADKIQTLKNNNYRNLQDELIDSEVYLERDKEYDERTKDYEKGLTYIPDYVKAQADLLKMAHSIDEERNILAALDPSTSPTYNPYYEKYLTRNRMQANTQEEIDEINQKINLFNVAKEKFTAISEEFLKAHADEEIDGLNYILMSSKTELLENKKKSLGADYIKAVANSDQSTWENSYRRNQSIIEIANSEKFKESEAYNKWIEAEKDFNFYRLISPSHLRSIENRIDIVLGIQEKARLNENLYKLKVRQLKFKIKNMKEALLKAKSPEDLAKIQKRIAINADRLKIIIDEKSLMI